MFRNIIQKKLLFKNMILIPRSCVKSARRDTAKHKRKSDTKSVLNVIMSTLMVRNHLK